MAIDARSLYCKKTFKHILEQQKRLKYSKITHYSIIPIPNAYRLTELYGDKSWFFHHKWPLMPEPYLLNTALLTPLLKEKNIDRLSHCQFLYYFAPRCLSIVPTRKSCELIFSPWMAIDCNNLSCKSQATNSFLNNKNLERKPHYISLYSFTTRCISLSNTTSTCELIFLQ